MRIRVLAWSAAGAVAVAALGACTTETACEHPEAVELTGAPERDIVGCWQGVGVPALYQAYLVVYDFEPKDGGELGHFREIQSPNQLYPSGQIWHQQYDLVADAGSGPVLQMEDLGSALVEITPLEMILSFAFQTQQGGTVVVEQPLRRAVCTGFGFEEPQDTCAFPSTPGPPLRGP